MAPKWLTVDTVLAIHAESVKNTGGSAGVRDQGLLESALGRARNLHAYSEDASHFALAAAYCSGIVKNHPFVDGNKRAGLLAAVAFLDLNGFVFRPEETDVVHLVMALAAGELDESALVEWFAEFSTSRPRDR